MAGNNRKRIRCTPIEGVWSHMADPIRRIHGYEPLALLYRDSTYIPDGVLVRSATGILAHYSGGGMRSIDQRKAAAALEWMERQKVDNGQKTDES